jgi:FkbM family methyltransferase
VIKPLKKYLSKRYPEVAAMYHSYRMSHEMSRHKLKSTPYGFKLMGNLPMQDGKFEPDETELIRQYSDIVEVFVDVGANVGYFVCLARSLNKHVLAAEPLAQNLDYLYANLELNGWKDVEVMPVGLSAKPGVTTLYGGGSGASLIPHWAGTSEVLRRTIPVSTLDVLVGERFRGRKLMIKIDVEGAEYEVLQGATKTLTSSPNPIWLLEICLTEHHPGGINPHFADIFNIFWSHGYEARTVGEQTRIVTSKDVERWVQNRKRDFGYVSYLFQEEKGRNGDSDIFPNH